MELATAEAAITAVRMAQLTAHPVSGGFDLAHLQAIHRFVFGPLYDWAGEIRTITLAKAGQEFCPPGADPSAGHAGVPGALPATIFAAWDASSCSRT